MTLEDLFWAAVGAAVTAAVAYGINALLRRREAALSALYEKRVIGLVEASQVARNLQDARRRLREVEKRVQDLETERRR